MEYSSNGYPVCPADELMRKNEGNLTRDEYAAMMGLKKPEQEPDGVWPVIRIVVLGLVALVALLIITGCSSTGMTREDRRDIGKDFCMNQGDVEKHAEVRKMMDDYVIEGFGHPSPQMFFFMGLACAKSEMT